MTFSLMSVLAFDKSLQGLHLYSGKLLTPPCALTQPRHLESEKVQNCSNSLSMVNGHYRFVSIPQEDQVIALAKVYSGLRDQA